jgi:hypothetical protein
MEDCAPFTFLGNWALVAPYMCSKFCIFDKPILDEYVSQVEGDPQLLQSCFRATWDSLTPIVREMHPSFESLVVTGALGM